MLDFEKSEKLLTDTQRNLQLLSNFANERLYYEDFDLLIKRGKIDEKWQVWSLVLNLKMKINERATH